VRQHGAVLQHGSILLHRLPIDESDLVRDACERATLRDATVTLEELGAPCDPRVVGDAIIAGFIQELRVSLAPTSLTAHGRG
jgi:hypothetical protein